MFTTLSKIKKFGILLRGLLLYFVLLSWYRAITSLYVFIRLVFIIENLFTVKYKLSFYMCV